jgi:hypothetical protein
MERLDGAVSIYIRRAEETRAFSQVPPHKKNPMQFKVLSILCAALVQAAPTYDDTLLVRLTAGDGIGAFTDGCALHLT